MLSGEAMLNLILEKSPLSGDAPCEKIIVNILVKRLVSTFVNAVQGHRGSPL